MARIRKINVSQVEGNNDSVLPAGTIAAYEINGEYVLRVHDGVTAGGIPFPNAPSIDHNNDINITVNSEDSSSYTWNFGQTGDLTAPGDIVVGGVDGGHIYIDGTEGANTSVRWINIPVGEDHSIIRAYTGNPTEETDLNRGRIQLAWQDNDRSGLRIISYDRSNNTSTTHEWTFQGDGGLEFPDGSVQTTAYTGSASSAFYVAVNVDGTISGSTDGVNWTSYTSNLNSISYVAVGPNKVVYVADSTGEADKSLWYADTYDTEPVEVTDISPREYSQIKYFKSISKFVAVGSNSAVDQPGLVYSSDGINWTEVEIDPTFLSTVVGYTSGAQFEDIEENDLGFFITSNDTTLGGFFVSDVTDTLDAITYVDTSNDYHRAVWASNGMFTGWHVFDTGNGVWDINTEPDPRNGTFESFAVDDVSTVFEELIGYDPSISDIVIGDYNGVSTIVIATSDGQIQYYPVEPNGPFVSIPKPYIGTITAWTDSATSAITISGQGPDALGEKFTVTGSSVTGYNGTYYIDDSNNTVYTDLARTIPFDTTGLDPFTGTATITWSHGQYIDALHYSNGIFYVGNDDEEVFTSTDGGATWTEVATLTSTSGEDFLNDIDSYVTLGNEFDRLVNSGNELVLESTGTLTLPSGGTISEGIVTSNPTIQLTPANPDVASQKLVIKGGGGEFFNLENGIDLGTNNNVWEVTDSATFYVYAPTRPNETLYWWIVPEEAGISTTMSGTVELDEFGGGVFNFTVISDAYEFRVRVSPEEDNYDPENIGVESVLMNGDAPSYGDYHLHLTTGDLTETSIFLGTDDHNVRTTTDGKIQITTPSETNNVWEFGTNGSLTFPDGMTIGNLNGSPAIQVNVDIPINILSQGSLGASNLQWINDLQEPTAISAVVVNSPFAEVGDVQIVTGTFDLQNPTAAEHSWTFGADGDLTLPNNSGIKSSTNIDITIDTPDSSTFNWRFGADGDLTFPDNTVQTTAYPGITNEAGGTASLAVGGSNMTRDALSVRVVAGMGSTLDVEINYSLAEASAIVMGSSTTVAFTQVLTKPLNIFSGQQTLTANNTTWTTINAETLSTIGDSVTAIISDNTFHKIYRVTVMTRTLPDVGVAGEAYCTIETLK
jgi:hypothetical protein